MFCGNEIQRIITRKYLSILLVPLAFFPLSSMAAPGEFDFGARLDNGPNSPAYAQSVVLGDLDDDGDLDVVVGNSVDRPNIVLMNDGGGQFVDSGQLLGNAGTLQMHLADFDGDSDLDLLTLNGSTQVQESNLYFNDGAGNFTVSTQQFSSFYQPRAAVGDVDADGDVDIVRGAGGEFEVLVNDGSGSFTVLRAYQSGGSYIYPNLGDVDGDGDLDLVTNDRRSYVYFNNGAGDFSNRQELAFNGNSSGQPVVFGDVNGDGNLDIAAPRYGSSPSLILGDGTGAFTDSGQSWLVENQNIRSLDFADVDADGDLDLMYSGDEYDPEARRWTGRLGILVNDGTGQLTQSERVATDELGGTYYLQFATGDIDGDNDLDAIVATSHGGAFVFLNSTNDELPAITSPDANTTLDSPSHVFSWGLNGYNDTVTDWALYAGSTPRGYDYFIDGFGSNTTGTVTGLPTGGQDVYVTLWWKTGGTWLNNGSFQYATESTGEANPTILAPAESTPATILDGETQVFTWGVNAYTPSVTQWALFAGSTALGFDYFIGGFGNNVSGSVTGLPTGGQDVYVTLWWKSGGTWANNGSVLYEAATVGGAVPTITSPADGSTLLLAEEHFSWSANAWPGNISQWAVFAGSTPGALDYYIGSHGTNGDGPIDGWPCTGSGGTVYVTLWWKDGGTWHNDGSNSYTNGCD